MMKAVRVLSEVDVLEAEIQRRHNELQQLQRRLSSLRGEPLPMAGATAPQAAEPVAAESDEVDGEVLPLAEIERRYILKVLEHFNGNRTHTARALGIGTNTLWRKLKAWGEPPARSSQAH